MDNLLITSNVLVMFLNDKPIIRAIAFFLEDSVSREYYIDKLPQLYMLRDRIIGEGYQVFSIRLVLANQSQENMEKIMGYIDQKDILVSAGYVNVEELDFEYVKWLVSNGYYVTIMGVWENPERYSRTVSRLIHLISSEDPVYATRVSIGFHGKPLITPYFPDTSSDGVFRIGYSFLLPNSLLEYYREEGSLDGYIDVFKNHVYNLIDLTRSVVRTDNVVFDYSISPWMDNSVVNLLNEMGFKLGSPGFNYGVSLLNSFINKIVKEVGHSTGFNEVMLPYAEDSILIEAGSKKLIRARDILLYSSTCIAGPDMIVVPQDVDKLTNYILDTLSIWFIKKKPMALRAIPVDAEPGDEVFLGRFGSVYVLEY